MRLKQSERNEAQKLLCDVVETVTSNPGNGEKPLAQRLQAVLQTAGIPAWLQEFAPGRANVVARLKGCRAGPALLLNGHLDTVPFGAADAWKTPPERATIRAGVLYGCGASDMKGGLCAALYALCLLVRRGFVPEHDILFVATGDEESQGLGANRVAQSGLLEGVGQIIIGEPTGNRVAIASKGILWLQGTVRSEIGRGVQARPAAALARQLVDAIRELIEKMPPHPYLTPPTCTLIEQNSNGQIGELPDSCGFILDIRTVPGISHQEILQKMKEAAQALCAAGAEISVAVFKDCNAVEIAPQAPLVQNLSNAVRQVCGQLPELIGTDFSSDAAVFWQTMPIPVVLFGPGESDEAHQPNESLLLAHYYESIECYLQFLQTISRLQQPAE